MILTYHRNFKKMFKKHPAWIKDKFEERIKLFRKDMFEPILNNHSLKDEWLGCKSINITGDVRAIFEDLGDYHFEFVAIGTHSELYS